MITLSQTAILVFGLVLARVSGLIVTAPVLGGRQAPAQTRIGLAVALSLIFVPLQLQTNPVIPADLIAYGVLAGRELLIGLAVGLAVAVVFHGATMGSQLIGIQIGFGLGGVLNPASGQESTILDNFYTVLATVIFLTANGHHAVLAALGHTFQVAPVGGGAAPNIDPVQVMAMIQSVFVVALRIAMPAIAALLLADVGLGLVGRVAPQMQIIIVGAPVKIAVGLLLLAASTPTTTMLMAAVFHNLNRTIATLIGG